MKNLKSIETKCLLIQPEFSEHSALNYKDVCEIVGAKYPIPPLNLITVAALFPQNWHFKLVDLNIESLNIESIKWADLVCTGGMLSQQKGILSLIELAHSFGKKVAIGGPEPTSQPDLYQHADYLVLGEGEVTIPDFLNDLSLGKEKGIYHPSGMARMNEAVVPRFDLIQIKAYLFMGLQVSRGCPYRCEFCNVIELFGRKPRAKKTEQVIAELDALYKLGYRGHIFFVDDNFLSNKKIIKELLKRIAEWSSSKKYPFYFAAETSIDLVNNDEVLELLKNADFRYISLGLETPENEVLHLAHKNQNMNHSIPEVVKKLIRYGIIVDASFILGFDNETRQTASLLIQNIQDAGICMAMIGTLYALPNTRLLNRLSKEKRLFTEETIVSDSNTEVDQMTSGLNFITKRSRKQILREYIHILESVYSPENYYERLSMLGLNLKVSYKQRPGFKTGLSMFYSFLKICSRVGFSHKTGLLYWRLIFKTLFQNPKAIEAVASLAAMYMHLSKHADFIIGITRDKISQIEAIGEKQYELTRMKRIS
ncbi:MAG: hypothetical protein A2X05_15440 [Bacteroidetes bacterium GWE2_41_25]|nr:MAG: hypothetical protein A2X05_15440 [Bacteroidetes bacterium GWE2_41_25]